jgi:predicted cupin superfamily sugar epimerase
MTEKAETLIRMLGMRELPGEGGWLAETYRAAWTLPAERLAPDGRGPRASCTAIYYLLRRGEISALHRLRSDEMWHFYQGDPLELCVIEPAGAAHVHTLGADIEAGQTHQVAVAAGRWFGARLKSGADVHGYALMGCTVSPGFDYSDFELASAARLLKEYPRHRALIEAFTRD